MVAMQVLMPGMVATKLSGLAADGWMVASPSEFARDAVSIIGAFNYSTGCLRHDLWVRHSLEGCILSGQYFFMLPNI